MSEDFLTIRTMCDRFDVTARTLRFYEAKELLSPVRRGQKRLFTRRDRARLKLIQCGKRFGFPLEDIRRLLDLYDLDDHQQTQTRQAYEQGLCRLAEMERQHSDLGETIVQLKNQLKLAEQMIADSKKSLTAN